MPEQYSRPVDAFVELATADWMIIRLGAASS
jgi:hypothetical protein